MVGATLILDLLSIMDLPESPYCTQRERKWCIIETMLAEARREGEEKGYHDGFHDRGLSVPDEIKTGKLAFSVKPRKKGG